MSQRPVRPILAGSMALLASIAFSRMPTGQEPSPALKPSTTIELFDGKSLAGFDTWLVDHHEADPDRVFRVDHIDGAPAIRISGEHWGGLLTKEAYRDYRLIVEYRWGGMTWGERKQRARDSGVLLHAQGRPGNTEKDFNGPWLRSVEFQIIEGGVGDIILVSGYADDGQLIRPSLKVTSRTDRDDENVYDPRGEPKLFSSGRINWWGRSEDWEDRLGMRGEQDVESPGLEWTRLEAVADQRNLTFSVNGKVVNKGSESSLAEGKIMFQAEGAEIYFRRIDLEPLP